MERTPGHARRQLQDAIRIMEALLRDLHPLDRALRDNQAGWPGTALHQWTAGTGDHSDPVGAAGIRPDPAYQARQRLYEAVDAAWRWADQLHHVHQQWRPAIRGVARCANPDGCPGLRLAERGRGGLCQPCYRAGTRPLQAA